MLTSQPAKALWIAGAAPSTTESETTNNRLERVESRIDQTNERLEVGLSALGARIDRTNERVDTLAQSTANGFARMETRLEEIARNTGTNYRELGARVEALETTIDPRLKALEAAWRAFLAKNNGNN